MSIEQSRFGDTLARGGAGGGHGHDHLCVLRDTLVCSYARLRGTA
jgi:hypothetical protein